LKAPSNDQAYSSEKIWVDEDVRMLHVGGEIIVSARQRQQAEQALQESEARLRAIGNALPDIVFVIAEEGRFVEILTSASNMNFLALFITKILTLCAGLSIVST